MNTPILLRGLLALVALVSVSTAIAHLSCLYLGPQCFRSQMAPDIIIESATNGTWLSVVGTIIVSFIFLLCAAYALAAANWLRPLPMQKLATLVIGLVSVIRGILPLQLAWRIPERLTQAEIIAGVVWLLCGISMLIGRRYISASMVRKVDTEANEIKCTEA